ncbi:MAG: rhodanese-like domain-containing protein [Tabrizicola sp.]|nr:rhodanese-like domain-containing protein [Tabrizicola sp.]
MLQRRTVLFFSAAAIGAAVVSYSYLPPAYAGPSLDPAAAHREAKSGAILLIDIRRPDEWRATGSGEGAHRLDMRHEDFIDQLSGLAGGDRGRPIALICARGVRSARLAKLLTESGFSQIINVPEGMLGSPYGPGWIARGLPVVTK